MHDKASVCLETYCNCCSRADRIRLEHIKVAAEDFTGDELDRRQRQQEERERWKAEQTARWRVGF